jgi:endonuclease YncB( thermonuclease family)
MKRNLIQFSRPLAKAGSTFQYFVISVVVILLAGCGPATPATPGAVFREETVALPTGAPTPQPTPVSTRVVPAEVLTPGPSPTITPLPAEVSALVVEVLDGETISVVLDDDPPGRTYRVRYLGIDAPPNTPSVPWGVVAFEINRNLTNGKVVRLERDESDVDADGNLLRYVYLGDDLLNITLVEQGLARANITGPDTRFQAEISEAEAQAEAGNLGLWGPPPTPTPRLVASPTGVITGTGIIIVTATPSEATAEPETSPTVEPEATGEETPTIEPETTLTAESEATSSGQEDGTSTAEPTGESTSDGD